jgi:tetratricopeptide (TPR) repeat protein
VVDSPEFIARRASASAGVDRWDAALSECQEAERRGFVWNPELLATLISTLPAEDERSGVNGLDGAKRLREYVTSVAMRSTNASSLNDFAWCFVTMGANNRAAADLAVKFAKVATENEPGNGSLQNTLGVAYYRAGQWQHALDALHKSMDLRQGGDAVDWFFLAAAHWQLGNKDDARRWYGKAIDWMDANAPTNPQLLRFRREVADLIGS